MKQHRNYRWLLVVQLYLVTALWGAVQVAGENRVLPLLFNALQASAVSLWVVLDARANGRPLIRIVQELHFFFWLLAAPIYLIGTRGFLRGISLTIAHIIGVYGVFLAGFYVTFFVCDGVSAFMQPRF